MNFRNINVDTSKGKFAVPARKELLNFDESVKNCAEPDFARINGFLLTLNRHIAGRNPYLRTANFR